MDPAARPIPLDVDAPIWDRVFTVAPLVLVGTRDVDGADDMAPKHMVTPLGWQNYWCFVCSPRHATHVNAVRTGEFAVSFPTPDQIVEATMAAAPREEGRKAALAAVETFPASTIDAPLLVGGYLFLECVVDRVLDGFGENSLIVGRIVAAAVDESGRRRPDRDDADLVYQKPLLAYLAPGRFARIADSLSFPFPESFRR